MKYFLFFLLLLPSVTALAVTPTNLHFGSVERGEIITREVLVVNTLEQNIDVIISGVYSDEFNLGPLESRIIGVELEIFDLSGNNVGEIGVGSGQTCNSDGRLSNPDSVEIDDAGNIYIGSYSCGTVQAYDSNLNSIFHYGVSIVNIHFLNLRIINHTGFAILSMDSIITQVF